VSPDIFIDTQQTKNLARTFTHPVLFFHRTLDSLRRSSIPSWNIFLAKAGLPALPVPTLPTNCSERTLPTVSSAANDVSHQLDELSGILTKYEGMSRKNSPPFPVKEDRKYFYEENTYTLQSSLGWGLNYTLKDLRNELTAARFNLGQYQTPTSHSQ
jgi:hypothetical protein